MKQLCMALALALIPGVAHGAIVTIDFEELSFGPQGVATLVYPDATFTSSTGNIFINGAALTNDFCAFDAAAFTCAGTLTVNFTSPVNSLTFSSAGEEGPGLLSNAAVYVNGVFAANVGISYDGIFTTYDPVNLTAFSNITSVVLTSTDFSGVTWDNFRFDMTRGTTPIPEPASLTLLGLGLTAGATRRAARARRS